MRHKNHSKANSNTPSTIICKDTQVEAVKLTSHASVGISGHYTGDLEIAFHISIEETGKVIGNIKAKSAVVSGEVHGNLDIEHQLHITKTGTVKGEIVCGSIVVDEDANIYSSCRIRNMDKQTSNFTAVEVESKAVEEIVTKSPTQVEKVEPNKPRFFN